eukprot:432223_1
MTNHKANVIIDQLLSVFDTPVNIITTTNNSPSLAVQKQLTMDIQKNYPGLNKQIAQDTLNIMENHKYINSSLIEIDIKQEMEFSYENTTIYTSNKKHKQMHSNHLNLKQKYIHQHNQYNKYKNMKIEIIHETTLNAMHRLCHCDEYKNVVAVNFASAKTPGGGWLNGAVAQEESIVRSSVLYKNLMKYEQDFYNFHKYDKNGNNNGLYTNSMIYSPNVPIVKDDNGNILDDFYCCSIITSCAVNVKSFMSNKRNDKQTKKGKLNKRDIVKMVMFERIKKIIDIALMYEHDVIILGAFGCGVFGNDVSVVADIFAELLYKRYYGCFKCVTFAILENKYYIYNKINAFQDAILKYFQQNIAVEHMDDDEKDD